MLILCERVLSTVKGQGRMRRYGCQSGILRCAVIIGTFQRNTTGASIGLRVCVFDAPIDSRTSTGYSRVGGISRQIDYSMNYIVLGLLTRNKLKTNEDFSVFHTKQPGLLGRGMRRTCNGWVSGMHDPRAERGLLYYCTLSLQGWRGCKFHILGRYS